MSEEEIYGKYFSMMEPNDSIIVIYKIMRPENDERKIMPKYVVERLEQTVEFVGEQKKKTFFVDNPSPDGNHLLIFTFTKGRVIVNTAFLDYNSVIISKKNILLDMQILYNEETTDYKEFTYIPNAKRQIAIIDIETGEELKPYLYMDSVQNKIMGKYKLFAFKKYFVFEVKEKNRNI